MQLLERSVKQSVNPAKAKIELGRRYFSDFVRYTKPDYQFNWHHVDICSKLDAFAKGKISKMMIFMPPQHGKSELATRRLPAYKLGLNPTTRIAICSYSDTLASAFNRDIQRVIDDTPYNNLFPNTYLNASNVSNDAHAAYLRNASIFETVGHRGFVKTVGVGGSLTGTPVDLGIIDDPFKDREEAMSIRIRDKVWSWYTDVFETRLHNESQQLLIMTRWDEDDLAGRILKTQKGWDVIIYQAVKEKDIPGDPRQIGEALWPEKHSLERLLNIKDTSPFTFSSLYQQEPKPSKDTLVFPEWSEYQDEPDIMPLYGLDFGFSNAPTALTQVKIRNKNMYVREVIYQRGLTNSQLSDAIKLLIKGYHRISADSAEPKTITDLRQRGVNITPAVKGPDSIISGINWLKEFNIFIHKDSHNLKRELNNYQWVMYGGVPTNIPIDSFNDLIDSMRYTKTLYRSGIGAMATFSK